MAIIALKAWYLANYQPIKEVLKRPQDLRLSRNSLLKSGLRADFLDDSEQVKQSPWFENYLAGETIEFYIEGSGGYVISNLDISSQEIYFTKRDVMANLDPLIFFSYQQEYPPANDTLLTNLQDTITNLNERSRISLNLEIAPRSLDGTIRLSDNQLRKIRKSLLFIADITPISAVSKEEKTTLIPSPNVCLEIGYALQIKRPGQILLMKQQREDLSGEFPFDLPHYQQLEYQDSSELSNTLPVILESLLQKFKLFS